MSLHALAGIEAVTKAVDLKNLVIDSTEDESFFSIAYQKDLIARKKKGYFQNRMRAVRLAVVVNSTNLGNVADRIDGHVVARLDESFFMHFDSRNAAHMAALEDCVVVLTNNNLAKIHPERMAKVVEATPRTLYAIHDYDCHHWYEMSIHAALLADCYLPAHPVDHSLAVRVNPCVIRGVPCGSIQWTERFLADHLPELPTIHRTDAPLGRHFFYERFKYRNRVVATLASHSPDTGIQTGNFHQLNAEERWRDWATHKLHWVVPVQDDLPIRFYDALVTGGIPLVPSGLLDYVSALGLAEHCLAYTPSDILDPVSVVARGLHEFDRRGETGIVCRYVDGMRSGHVDRIVATIFRKVLGAYCEG